jgi:hypothetical protein
VSARGLARSALDGVSLGAGGLVETAVGRLAHAIPHVPDAFGMAQFDLKLAFENWSSEPFSCPWRAFDEDASNNTVDVAATCYV